ncbi:hypothetical protein SERLA73DRAFT_69161 [Serpula lacrymans var. lacrymans S7.3]|uniref:Uncharacterized protein n=2 Tax=Serpula lacrymans var. lacrymans TaxID=341189 RepID=F8PK18_SERL3|nr:uncharacterized protein SERLADRAFT_433051 [Serpula lacrymans var. lacrymans S7.9]EGO03258.1 hypothetical protein SERLA73DRAFT_69161 [Serpula lacrymans var. lacrymans S7.3]EGO29041.1 hypothetical protein SERLADRAFT_433051 [Serpula lacrymans var. lacrymans S7.9]
MKELPWLLSVGAKGPHPSLTTPIQPIYNPLLNNAIALAFNVAMPVKNMAIMPFTVDTIPALYVDWTRPDTKLMSATSNATYPLLQTLGDWMTSTTTLTKMPNTTWTS